MIPLKWGTPRVIKLIETERRRVVAKDSGKRENGESVFNDYRVL